MNKWLISDEDIEKLEFTSKGLFPTFEGSGTKSKLGSLDRFSNHLDAVIMLYVILQFSLLLFVAKKSFFPVPVEILATIVLKTYLNKITWYKVIQEMIELKKDLFLLQEIMNNIPI